MYGIPLTSSILKTTGNIIFFWGSFSGIYVVELESDGLSVKRDKDGMPVLKQQVCGTAFEGVNIYKKRKILLSVRFRRRMLQRGQQHIQDRRRQVGEHSRTLCDKNGKKMLDNGYEVVIRATLRGPAPDTIP